MILLFIYCHTFLPESDFKGLGLESSSIYSWPFKLKIQSIKRKSFQLGHQPQQQKSKNENALISSSNIIYTNIFLIMLHTTPFQTIVCLGA